MKALTVKQPWAWAIIHGGKDVENRSRPTKYRGQLYIHAGKGWADEGILGIGIESMPADEDLLSGYVIGTVDVVDCHPATECFKFGEPACSPWAIRSPEQFHWVLDNPRPLATPFPEKGKLGIWNLGASS